MQGSLFQPPERKLPVRVGPAGWNYKDWEGTVYPAKTGGRFDALAFLADYFDTVEINSSFYRPPRADDARAWARRVANNRRFKFTAKVWQQVTHGREIDPLRESCGAVGEAMDPLAESGLLGALLLQFPWSFRNTPENLDYLDTVLRMLARFPLVVEVRHGSWDDPAFFEFLREHGAGFCNIDQPVMGESLRPTARATSRVGYLRFHGRNYKNWFRDDAETWERYDYLYPKSELQELTEKIREVAGEVEETYAITNNHFRGQAVANAVEILELLEGVPQEAPPQLAATYPHLVR